MQCLRTSTSTEEGGACQRLDDLIFEESSSSGSQRQPPDDCEATENCERPATSQDTLPPSRVRIHLPNVPSHPDVQLLPPQIVTHPQGGQKAQKTKCLTFQKSWFGTFPWLHYASEVSGVVCFYCAAARQQEFLKPSRQPAPDAFTVAGFTNWRKAKEKFAKHENSEGHKNAVYQYSNLQSTSVRDQISTQTRKQQEVARRCLKIIFQASKFLLRQGLPFRGHSEKEGNFYQYLVSREEDNEEFTTWMKRNTTYTSPLLQNEMIELFGKAVQKTLSSAIPTTNYAIIVDGTRDVAGVEQQSICVRYVDEHLRPTEVFLGLCTPPNTKGATIAEAVMDFLTKIGLPLSGCRAQTYDGAANMSGEFNGCQAIIKSLNPLAIYFHCGAHSSNLVAGDVSDCCPELREALMAVRELGALSARSGKFKQIFYEKKLSKNIKPLCPTRFLCRRPAISAALDEQEAVIASLEELMKEAPAEQSAKIGGILRSMESGNTRLLLEIALRVFAVLEDLNTYLQGRSSTVQGMFQVVESAKRELRHLRTEEVFDELFERVAKAAEDGKVHPVEPPRFRRRPARYEKGSTTDVPVETRVHFRRVFFSIVDAALSGIERRFNPDSEGIVTYKALESVLLNTPSEADMEAMRRYKDIDFKKVMSRVRLLHEEHSELSSVDDLAAVMRNMHVSTRLYFKEVESVLRIILVMPVSSCEAERSFSALRRLKTWLRSTMGETRLSCMALTHVHQDVVDSIELPKLMCSFVSACSNRALVFGPPQRF